MDEELKRLLDEAVGMGATTDQLDDILNRYNAKKKWWRTFFRKAIAYFKTYSITFHNPIRISRRRE